MKPTLVEQPASETPTHISELDSLRLENLATKRELYLAQKQVLETQFKDVARLMGEVDAAGEKLSAELREKYKMTEADSVDLKTLAITRTK